MTLDALSVNEEEESTLHILRNCPAARSVWRKIGKQAGLPSFFQGELKAWIMSNLKFIDDSENESWSILFCTALWWIWRWRNCYVFWRSNDIPVDVGGFLKVRVEETKRSLLNLEDCHSTAPHRRIERYISWQAPPFGWYAMNTDGAAKGCPGPAGGGAIIRNQHGSFISAFAGYFGHCNSFKAEITALVSGLDLARDLQIRNLVIQVDNLACVQALTSKESGSGECAHLINYCKRVINKDDWVTRIVHIYREGNRAADWLANHGVAQSLRTVILEDVPLALVRIIDEDIRGVAFPRLIPP